MIDIVVVNCGYVESSRACLGTAFIAEESFKDSKEAIRSLANWFLHKFKIDNKNYQKSCCTKQKKNAKFCPECGRNLQHARFDQEDFAYWISQHCCGTADGWGDGWGDRLYLFSEDGSTKAVQPDWEVATLNDIVENPNKVCVLSECGDQHLAAYAAAIEEGAEPHIPDWWPVSDWSERVE